MALATFFRLPRHTRWGLALTLPAVWVRRWRMTLGACLPEPLREVLTPRDPHLDLELGPGQARLYQGLGPGRQTLVEVEDPFSQRLDAVVLGHQEPELRTRLRLPREWVVTRNLSLPSQASSKLRQVIGYEIDRFTPFQADQVYYDYRLSEHQAKPGRITLELALCRREPLQAWLKRMHQVGAPVDGILWPGAWPEANLLPEGEMPRSRDGLLRTGNLLILLIIALAAVVLAGPLWQRSQVLQGLEKELILLKARTKEVDSLREAIEQAHQGSMAVLERKANQATMTDLLRELTDRLPDGTWVENLEFQGQEVQIRGESTHSAALIGLLEQAPVFSGVSFRSPVSQVPNTDRERFHIGFTYLRKGVKS